jgi:hypothetical protein
MAVVMEVPWSRATGELGSNSPAALELTKGKKASSSSPSQQQQHVSWGADAQKVVQLMMGQLRSSPSAGEQRQQGEDDDSDDDVTTLDLLGCNNININISKAVAPSSSHQREEFKGHNHHHNSNSAEFLELDPDQPLPPGWEKCLDLKVTNIPSPNLPRDFTPECTLGMSCIESLNLFRRGGGGDDNGLGWCGCLVIWFGLVVGLFHDCVSVVSLRFAENWEAKLCLTSLCEVKKSCTFE